MRKKLAIITLVCAAMCCLALAACKRGSGKPAYEIYGFSVPESVEVEYGQSYTITRPCVTDSWGNTVDVDYKVTDSFGREVETSSQTFFATDGGGYTIVFSLTDYDGKSHSAQTHVSVLNARDLVLVSGKIWNNNQQVELTPACTLTDPEYSYSVKRGNSEIAVETVEGRTMFTPTGNGIYDVHITAVERAAQNAGKRFDCDCKILVRNPAENGEVEKFDEFWAASRELEGLGTYGWRVVEPEESGIKDRFGNEKELLGITVTDEDLITSPRFYLNPRDEWSHYEALAEEGYDTMSVWLYTDAPRRNVNLYRSASRTNGSARVPATLMPGEWVRADIPVTAAGQFATAGCLETQYETWKHQLVWLLRVDNSLQTFPLTVYVDDVFLTQNVAISQKSGAVTAFETGETLTPADLVTCEGEYTVSFMLTDEYGLKEYIDADGNYKFLHNGSYTLTATVEDNNAAGSVTVPITVTDDVTIGDGASVERTAPQQTVTLSALGCTLERGGEPLAVKQGTLKFYDNEVPVTGGAFVAEKDGCYIYEVCADYTVEGETYTTYKDFTIDVWSEENKYGVFSTDGMKAIHYSTPQTAVTATAGEYNIAGLNAHMLKIDSIAGFGIAARPMYSKRYYEALASEVGEDKEFSVSFYGNDITVREFMFSDPANSSEIKIGTYGLSQAWHTSTHTLKSLIANYQTLAEGYEEVSGYLLGKGFTSMSSYGKALVCGNKSGGVTGDFYLVESAFADTVESSEVVLKDINGLSELNLTDLIETGEREAAAGGIVAISHDVYLTSITGAGTVPTADIKTGLYTVSVFKGGAVVYRGKADIYDSDREVEFVDMTTTDSYDTHTLYHTRTLLPDGCDELNGLGLAGDFFRAQTSSNNSGAYGRQRIIPLHSREYYETVLDGDLTEWNVTFDLYLRSADGNVHTYPLQLMGETTPGDGKAVYTSVKSGRKYSYGFSLDKVLDAQWWFYTDSRIDGSTATVTGGTYGYLGNVKLTSTTESKDSGDEQSDFF